MLEGVDGEVMGGADSEWDDSWEHWGNSTQLFNGGDSGDRFLVKLSDGAPLLSQGSVNCDELVWVYFSSVNTRRYSSHWDRGNVLLVLVWDYWRWMTRG